MALLYLSIPGFQPCEESGKTSEQSSLTIYGDNLIMNTVKFKTNPNCQGEIAYQTASIFKFATSEATLLDMHEKAQSGPQLLSLTYN